MTKKTIILFIAEIAAVALLRAIYVIRRDRLDLPKAGKVRRINNTPVYRPPSRSEVQFKPKPTWATYIRGEEPWTP